MDVREMAFQYHTDVNLLATLICDGTRVQAINAAGHLLRQFGSLRALMDADARSVGGAKHAKLQAAMELARRVLEETMERCDTLRQVSTTREYLMLRLRHHPDEVFAVLFLDIRNRVIAYEELFFGTIDGASVHPRQVVRRTLHHNAAALILAHNHPSGVAEPSRADEQITQRLKEALGLIDVRVLDHFVIGDGESVSFAERGLI